jgi:Uncharacterised nucleotidyltransferase
MNATTSLGSPRRREHELLLACARAELMPVHRERIATLLSDEIDWAFLLAEARHHRLVQLVYHHLVSLAQHACPSNVLGQMRTEAHQIAGNGIRQVSELCALVTAFDDAGIPILSFKGPVAAQSLYDNIAFRVSADLDLLVKRRDAEPAFQLLNTIGYEPQLPLSPAWRKIYVRTNHERDRALTCIGR